MRGNGAYVGLPTDQLQQLVGMVERLRMVSALAEYDERAARVVEGASRCDLLIEVPRRDGQGALSLVIEVQEEVEPTKRGSWAAYWAEEYHRRECGQVWFLVIALTDEVATWADDALARVIPEEGRRFVLGPRLIKPVIDVERARECPELAVLGALMHAGCDDVRMVPAVVVALRELEPGLGDRVRDVVRERMSPDARRALDEQLGAAVR